MKPLLAMLLSLPLHADSLFDGKTLEHWSGKAEHWRVEDGAITGGSSANSGIQFRGLLEALPERRTLELLKFLLTMRE